MFDLMFTGVMVCGFVIFVFYLIQKNDLQIYITDSEPVTEWLEISASGQCHTIGRIIDKKVYSNKNTSHPVENYAFQVAVSWFSADAVELCKSSIDTAVDLKVRGGQTKIYKNVNLAAFLGEPFKVRVKPRNCDIYWIEGYSEIDVKV